MLRTLFSFDNLAITIATIAVVGLLYVIPKNFDFLNPVSKALGDLDITDMVFSQFRNEDDTPVDTNIVLVNIGMAERSEIAMMLRHLSRHEPAAVGIDAFFRTPKDSASDTELAEAMAQVRNLVLVSKVAFKKESAEEDVERWAMSDVAEDEVYDTLETSHPLFTRHAAHGYANLVLDQEAAFMTCREVSFVEPWGTSTEYSFPVELARVVNPEAAKRAIARGQGEQTVNFHGNYGTFYHVDAWQALDPDFDLSFVRGKIVLLGFMGPDLETRSLEDAFFTPLNDNYIGRSFPDMYGVVIHANVITMILRGNYIESMDQRTSILIGLLVLVANVMMFTWMYEHHEKWYDMFAVAVQLGESLGIMYLIIVVFGRYDYKLALTPALLSVFLVGTVHDLYQDSLKKIIVGGLRRVKRGRKSATSDSA